MQASRGNVLDNANYLVAVLFMAMYLGVIVFATISQQDFILAEVVIASLALAKLLYFWFKEGGVLPIETIMENCPPCRKALSYIRIANIFLVVGVSAVIYTVFMKDDIRAGIPFFWYIAVLVFPYAYCVYQTEKARLTVNR